MRRVFLARFLWVFIAGMSLQFALFGQTFTPPNDFLSSNIADSQSAAPFFNQTTQAIPPTENSLAPAAPVVDAPVFDTTIAENNFTSVWYFKQDAFFWNERVGGHDFVNERGPLSTVGYQRNHGLERFRIELFGGTVAYDGGAQFSDGSIEPYHDSVGTNYLGLRGEYDLLIEPKSWSKIRLLAGIGTRFWLRDLKDAVTPNGNDVWGYQETWWTFYPYLGIETKEASEPGPKFFASAKVGCTPLTYQMASYEYSTPLYPKCGVMAQTECGFRLNHFSLSACAECMTWGASDVRRDAYQPASTLVTIGGRLCYGF